MFSPRANMAEIDKDTRVNIEPSPEIVQPSNSSIGHVEEGDFVTVNEQQDLSRGLHQRHVSLIAIAGAIVSLCNCYPNLI